MNLKKMDGWMMALLVELANPGHWQQKGQVPHVLIDHLQPGVGQMSCWHYTFHHYLHCNCVDSSIRDVVNVVLADGGYTWFAISEDVRIVST